MRAQIVPSTLQLAALACTHVRVAQEVEVLHQHHGTTGARGDAQLDGAGATVDELHVVLPGRTLDVPAQHNLPVPRHHLPLLLHTAAVVATRSGFCRDRFLPRVQTTIMRERGLGILTSLSQGDGHYNAAGAILSASEHEPSSSPRETTQCPSPSLDGVFFTKTATKKWAERTRCTCPNRTERCVTLVGLKFQSLIWWYQM